MTNVGPYMSLRQQTDPKVCRGLIQCQDTIRTGCGGSREDGGLGYTGYGQDPGRRRRQRHPPRSAPEEHLQRDSGSQGMSANAQDVSS